MHPAYARALHSAGLTSPELVGLADEQTVAEALAAAMARAALAKPKPGTPAAKGCVACGEGHALMECSTGHGAPTAAARHLLAVVPMQRIHPVAALLSSLRSLTAHTP
jgi:hypothetical protein